MKRLIPGWKVCWDQVSVDTVVVIPAIEEYDNVRHLISSLLSMDNSYCSSTLVLFVVNNTERTNNQIRINNAQTIEYLKELITKKSGLNVGFIDASSPGKELSNKEGGVGFARKIGMDLALELFDYSSTVKKVLICLDADCVVSTNYLTHLRNFFNSAADAASIYFEHPFPLTDAIICYELFLRYYVASLRKAQSKYAFHTIGSSMACSLSAYIKAGGMNKRKAAEDFYFLEKLAKFTPVKTVTDVTVYPSARESWRVPFGTGQRMTRFDAKTHDEFSLYSPHCFEILKDWLVLLDELPNSQPNDILNKAGEISPHLKEFLLQNNFVKDWDNIFRTSRSEKQISNQIDLWFDGFKTLKLIHYLRDTIYPNIFMFTALDVLFDKLSISFDHKSGTFLPDYEVRLNYLNVLRNFDRQQHL